MPDTVIGFSEVNKTHEQLFSLLIPVHDILKYEEMVSGSVTFSETYLLFPEYVIFLKKFTQP